MVYYRVCKMTAIQLACRCLQVCRLESHPISKVSFSVGFDFNRRRTWEAEVFAKRNAEKLKEKKGKGRWNISKSERKQRRENWYTVPFSPWTVVYTLGCKHGKTYYSQEAHLPTCLANTGNRSGSAHLVWQVFFFVCVCWRQPLLPKRLFFQSEKLGLLRSSDGSYSRFFLRRWRRAMVLCN